MDIQYTEFEHASVTYRIGPMPAMKQFHVSRRIAAIIPSLVPLFLQMSKKDGNILDLFTRDALQPFADALADMKDADFEYVVSASLSVVQRYQPEFSKWTPVWTTAASAPMFDDLGLDALLPLTVRVIQVVLGPFIRGLLMSQLGGQTQAPEAAAG